MKFEDRPLVYIAGPYTNPDPVVNTHNAIYVADHLNSTGLVTAHVPHLTLIWHMIIPHDDIDYWYEYDMAVLKRSDALYRMKGASSGADNEVLFAEKHCIPVFYDIATLREWATGYEGV